MPPAKFNGTLNPPKEMPPAEIQRIKNLRCPPPIKPSTLTRKLKSLYADMREINDNITNLENHVKDLEKRYTIAFSANPEIKYDLKPSQKPYIEVSGSTENIILIFHMWPARNGRQGIPGPQGNMGNIAPTNPTQGIDGNRGYYGIRGNNSK